MTSFERVSYFVGFTLIGLAAYLVAAERKLQAHRNGQSKPRVEELGEKLKEAWAEHHHA